MTDLNLPALSELCEKATPESVLSRIRYDHGGGRTYVEGREATPGYERHLVIDCYDEANREFYAAFNPETAKALIQRVRELEGHNAKEAVQEAMKDPEWRAKLAEESETSRKLKALVEGFRWFLPLVGWPGTEERKVAVQDALEANDLPALLAALSREPT